MTMFYFFRKSDENGKMTFRINEIFWKNDFANETVSRLISLSEVFKKSNTYLST